MIPKLMETFLKQQLPERTWTNRLVHEGGMCFMDFNHNDIERLSRLGIQADNLGPKLVACMWDEESPLEIGGYLVVDNLSMGRPSLGGIRMLPDMTPSAVFNLARAMTLKNTAANLPFGGGKAGVIAPRDLPSKEHTEVVRRIARLLFRYRDIFLPGPDVTTTDEDMKIIAIENGLDCVVSKPAEMGGNQVDKLGAGGSGLIIALQALLEELPRLRVLPQFAGLTIPANDQITLITQGFGAVGSNTARCLCERLPGAKVVGISDGWGYLYRPQGLPIDILYPMAQEYIANRKTRSVTRPYFQEHQATLSTDSADYAKFSNFSNDLLRESAFCLVPAAHIANYLGIDETSNPTITVEEMGQWRLIIEGANTYSPEPARKTARAHMEREVYRRRGVMIATDYLVNSGGVIFAAQEKLIKTPASLRIPDEMLGKQEAVEKWLLEHGDALQALAEKRRQAGEAARNEVIRYNIHELVSWLISDPDMLPCDAAESITIGRITAREKNRTARDIMESVITIPINSTVRQAAKLLVEAGSPILVVVNEAGELVGVATDWDITCATAAGPVENTPLAKIMTKQVVTVAPDEGILELVRKLEYYEISAMPVVDGGIAIGMITTDLLSRRTLLRLLQSKIE